MSQLKPMQKFSEDVKKGDLVRIVFERGEEMAGYVHDTITIIGASITRVGLGTSSIKYSKPKDKVLLEAEYEEPNTFKFDNTLGTRLKDNEKIIGYEILKKK